MDVEATTRGEVLKTERGKAMIEVIAPGVVRVSYDGIASADFAKHIQPRLDEWIADGHRIMMAIDARGLKAYDSEFRRAWSSWLDDNKAHLDGVHILSGSRLVKMGISLVNAVTGGVISGYVNHHEFESAIGMATPVETAS